MKTKIFFVTVLILIFVNAFAKNINEEDGKIIFTTRCAACHNVNVKVVGPALANVDQRRSIDWIVKFVHSSQTLVKQNDFQAVTLFKEFNQTVMPDQPDLSAEQVKSVIAFIKLQTKSTSASGNAPFATPGKLQPNYIPVSINNLFFFGIYIALILILIGCLVVAVEVKEIQRRNIKKEPVVYQTT